MKHPMQERGKSEPQQLVAIATASNATQNLKKPCMKQSQENKPDVYNQALKAHHRHALHRGPLHKGPSQACQQGCLQPHSGRCPHPEDHDLHLPGTRYLHCTDKTTTPSQNNARRLSAQLLCGGAPARCHLLLGLLLPIDRDHTFSSCRPFLGRDHIPFLYDHLKKWCCCKCTGR